jgi:hypothetical protein
MTEIVKKHGRETRLVAGVVSVPSAAVAGVKIYEILTDPKFALNLAHFGDIALVTAAVLTTAISAGLMVLGHAEANTPS